MTRGTRGLEVVAWKAKNPGAHESLGLEAKQIVIGQGLHHTRGALLHPLDVFVPFRRLLVVVVIRAAL